jgi:hypothetical protein
MDECWIWKKCGRKCSLSNCCLLTFAFSDWGNLSVVGVETEIRTLLLPNKRQRLYFTEFLSSDVEIKNTYTTFSSSWLFRRFLTTLYLCHLYVVEEYDDSWLINYKEFCRERSWPIRGTIPEFAWRNWGKTARNLSQNSRCLTLDSNSVPH